MRKNLAKYLVAGTLGVASLFGSVKNASAPLPNINRNYDDNPFLFRSITDNYISLRSKKLHQEILSYGCDKDTLYVPEYFKSGKEGVPSTNCAKYVRQASKDLFDLEYGYDTDVLPTWKRGAWNYRYYNKIVSSSETGFSREDIKNMVDEGKIQPGTMIGIYNPGSAYNDWKDKTGKKVRYTHLGIFLGNDEKGFSKVAHLWGPETRVDNIEWFYERGLKPREIIDVKDKKFQNF